MAEKICKDCGQLFWQYNTVKGICDHCQAKRYAKKRNPLKREGKVAKKWKSARQYYFKKYPAPTYNCYLCGKLMTKSETTLDHVIPRSRRPDLRNEIDNLKPCCWECNSRKGSQPVDKFLTN